MITVYAHDYNGNIDTMEFDSRAGFEQWFSEWDGMGYQRIFTDQDNLDLMTLRSDQIYAWFASSIEQGAPVRTARIESILHNENEAFVYAGNTLIVASRCDEFGYPDYQISYHDGMMPAFEVERYITIEGLCRAMQRMAKLSEWRHLYGDNGETRA